MYILLTILCVIAAVLLVLLVLVQNSKGGGLAAGFNSGNQVMGVRKTTDFLEKATWTLIALIVLMSIFAVGASKRTVVVDPNQSAISEQAVEANQEIATPVQGFNEEETGEE
ncbi:MAG: preprotein translocase subunit SecG [Paludibacteraceae bacterium]|nr:preprotein translocase subunit SecG [Paludibacteraceae bacterium]